jgi:hypothetical protein
MSHPMANSIILLKKGSGVDTARLSEATKAAGLKGTVIPVEDLDCIRLLKVVPDLELDVILASTAAEYSAARKRLEEKIA